MNFDALVNVKRILNSASVSPMDIMLLSSAVNNRSVDINISIQSNIDTICMQDIDNHEFMIYISEFIGSSQEFLNTPIYKKLIQNKIFWPSLLNFLKKKLINDEAFLDIVNYLFHLLKKANIKEYVDCFLFINEFLSAKKEIITESTDVSFDIIEFIINNLDCLDNNYEESSSKLVAKKIVINLLSLGIVGFYDLVSISQNESDLINTILSSLLKCEEYYYLVQIINEKTIDNNTSQIIEEILRSYINSKAISDGCREYINRILKKLIEINESSEKSLKITEKTLT